jgi:hypothetical protein
MISTTIVVARYNEELAWTEPLSRSFDLYIYNKGEPLPAATPGRVCQLPNVGRESHTYLTHLIDHYENLPDLLVFMQGRIDDLGPWVHADPMRYAAQALQYGFSASAYTVMNPSQWLAIDFASDPSYAEAFRSGSLQPAEKSMIDYAHSYLGPLPLLTLVSLKGCFAVSRRAVHARPREFYLRLRDTVGHHSNPVEGHYLERLWALMFSNNSLLLQALKVPLSAHCKFQDLAQSRIS